MERKGPQALTETELNAAVYRYLQESGFVHSAFIFFHEAGIEKGNIQGKIPQGALITIVQKGLQYIELEANFDNGSDDEHHFFDTLDLMTNDLDELKKKVTSSAKRDSVKNDKRQKINFAEIDKAQNVCSVETDRAQKIGSAETITMSRKKPIRKMKAAQNNNPDGTATMCRTQPLKHTILQMMKHRIHPMKHRIQPMKHRTEPMKHAKAQGIDSKEQTIRSDEIAQKVASAETRPVYRNEPLRTTKSVQNSSPDQPATVRGTQTMKPAKTQGINSKEQNNRSDEIAQKVASAETRPMYRNESIRKTKAVQKRSPDQPATARGTQTMKPVKTQGINSKEQNIISDEIAQKAASSETRPMYKIKIKKKPIWKTNVVQNSSPDQPATVRRIQPMKHGKTQGIDSKEQNISAAETAQKVSSVVATTEQVSQLSWIGKKPRLQKRKR